MDFAKKIWRCGFITEQLKAIFLTTYINPIFLPRLPKGCVYIGLALKTIENRTVLRVTIVRCC